MLLAVAALGEHQAGIQWHMLWPRLLPDAVSEPLLLPQIWSLCLEALSPEWQSSFSQLRAPEPASPFPPLRCRPSSLLTQPTSACYPFLPSLLSDPGHQTWPV